MNHADNRSRKQYTRALHAVLHANNVIPSVSQIEYNQSIASLDYTMWPKMQRPYEQTTDNSL